MTPERWRQIEELYHSARERGGEALAGADPEICREVERLLAQDSESGDKLLDQDAADLIADTADVQLTPGTQLGPYKIEALLGQGAMGQVYRATDTRLERPVAIKICKRAFLDRFRQESRSIAAISHPNVCTLHDVGPNYLVMELVEGETMAARLKRGRLTLAETLRFGAQIAAANRATFSTACPIMTPVTFLGLACFLAIVALLASLVPALHALRGDPMIALRYE